MKLTAFIKPYGIHNIKKKKTLFFSVFSIFLSLKYKYTIMCNYLNKYNNLYDAHYIRYTSLWKMYKNVRIPYLSGIFSKRCSNKKKSHRSQSIYPCPNILIPLAKWTIYASMLKSKCFFLKFKFKWGGPFAHEVVLMKFELQTHIEHLSSYRSGSLVVFVRLNLQFSGYS